MTRIFQCATTVGSQRTPEVSEDEEDDIGMIAECGVY